MKQKPNYAESFAELQHIVSDIEKGDIPVDDLAEKIKRAGVLIRICREKLAGTEEDVAAILKEMEEAG